MGYIKDIAKEYYTSKPAKEYKDKLISPSMLGGCPRVQYYKLNGISETTPPDTNAQLNFDVGNLWEAKIAEFLDVSKVLIYWWNEGQSERMSVNKDKWVGELRNDKWEDLELGVAGTPDIVYKQNDKNVLLDVKTMKAKSASYIATDSDEDYWKEHKQYRLQLGLYLILNHRRFDAGLEKVKCDYGKLCIISKDTGAIIKEPCLFLSKELEDEVYAEIKSLREYLDSNKIPPCTCEGWMTGYCSYGSIDSIKPNKQGKPVPTKCCEHISNK
jgi:hypothetical protein